MFIYVGVHLSIWSNLILYSVATILGIAFCTPREKTRNPLLETRFCIRTYEATAVFNVISDFAMLILPMPCIWNLRMPLKRKILIMATFGTGFL